MIGARGACQRVVDGFRAGVVARLAALDDPDAPLPDGAVAEPRLLAAAPLPPETVPLDDWPFVTVNPGQTTRLLRTDTEGAEDVYLVTYQLTALAWCTGPGFTETDAGRDRLVQALVELLLTEGTFGTDAAVLRETISVNWAPTGVDEALEAIVSAAAIAFTLGVEEGLAPVDPPEVSDPDGWVTEVDAVPAGWDDTLNEFGGAPPPGTV